MVSSLKKFAMDMEGEGCEPIRETGLARHLFHCHLDDQPDHLVPQRYLRDWESPADRPLFVNRDCHFTKSGELPSMVGESAWLIDHFALDANIVWIEDRVRHSLNPFWIGLQLGQALTGLRPGDRAPSTLSSDALHVLARANVLVPADHLSSQSRRWNQVMSRSATEFEGNRYTPIGELIHPFHISALRRYYRHLIRQGRFKLGDDQSPLRYTAQNESVARFFHHQLTATVARIVEEPVKPSYVYLGSYQGGSELEVHIDREQCEFSISLCIDYSPEPARETPWPLHLHTRTGRTRVFQGIGDALLYSGRELPHSRDPLPQRNTSTSLFFHYVRESFAGALK
jgi:hypothetical protein